VELKQAFLLIDSRLDGSSAAGICSDERVARLSNTKKNTLMIPNQDK